MDAPTVALEALKIAGQICIYSNDQIVVESL
jgi:ATP-dependent protease HslVU (ClpYQ) peptidase subunit